MNRLKTEVVVVGAGPGGYTAAFYAADRGKKVILVERERRLGGVCLNLGCIPSKALLHATYLIREAKESANRGITYAPPEVNIEGLRAWKDSVLERLGGGVKMLADRRGVEVIHGRGYFEDSNTLRVETSEGQNFISFDAAIIATGSRPLLPSAFDLGNKRIMTSSEALDLAEIPETLLIVGGGYIGLELGCVYATLGSRIILMEAMVSLLPGADTDLIWPVQRFAERHFSEVRVSTKVIEMATSGRKIRVISETAGKQREEYYDSVLVAVGRRPFCDDLGLENTKVERDEKGFIRVNERQETSDRAIYAIGDVVGGMLLAHKASKEARIAVEVICGERSAFQNVIIPAVIFTDPEMAWCGLTETQAKKDGISVRVVRFPWAASGRALTFDRPDGVTKLIVEPETERILGVGISGFGAGELIAEGVLAIEMGATAMDLAESVHPHPTLSETLMECAEAFYGYATHTISRRAREK